MATPVSVLSPYLVVTSTVTSVQILSLASLVAFKYDFLLGTGCLGSFIREDTKRYCTPGGCDVQ